ncbi:unnamed protein product [Bemisia tabaci]|uniref:Phospholipase A2-like domain-containing protein n=1 Tax=Bemisia tabaci TaxID=7038 RepID=A0A9P0A9A1_BEMTA|nr:unnamed protein product [Bemisia tabaci]
MLAVNRKRRIAGRGIINSLVSKLPFELHLPGYQFCGPSTRLAERLKRGDKGINLLDQACLRHDQQYEKYTDLENRHKADRVLIDEAWKRFKSKDASLGEKAASYLVTNIMKGKLAMGAGLKKRKRSSVRKTKKGKGVRKTRRRTPAKKRRTSKRAKASGGGVKKRKRRGGPVLGTRVIPLPKRGGILQYLIPLLTGLSNIGSVAGTANELLKTIRAMKGKGLSKKGVLGDFKKGYGLYLKPYPSQDC